MPISIYPPTLSSSQPPFWYEETSYSIYFTLQRITQFSEIGHIQIRIVKQSNNSSIAKLSKYPDGTIYKPPSEIQTSGNQYYISILQSDLSETWQPGTLYKIQMRFGTTAMYTSIAGFSKWKQDQIDNQTFSEWSTVMIIKAITKPQVIIENAEAKSPSDIGSAEKTEFTLTPLFFGTCIIPERDKELVEEYQFNLYLGEKTLEEFLANEVEGLVESSGWKEHNARDGTSDRHRFQTFLTNNTTYTLIYSIRTVNGYVGLAAPYKFLATQSYLGELTGVHLYVNDDSEYCRENGCIDIQLTTDSLLSGSFVLTRSSEKTNYAVWESLKYFIFAGRKFTEETIYNDFTIESGVKYKYAFQQENSAGFRSQPVFTANNSPHYIDFEYSYLYHDDIQLRLMFNNRVNSFKHTTLTSKQDTLGDRYPHLSRNGYAYYAEFPISGLISFQMDPDRTFLKLEKSGFMLDGETKIPRDKFTEQSFNRLPCIPNVDTAGLPGQSTNYNDLTINSDLTPNNVFIERKFREEVEKFLNNFDYKLYKSPTEGNIIVVLQNVSMTPNASLGRMIYEFSATAYEVAENNLENLEKKGIINIGKFGTISSNNIIVSLGQVAGLYTSSEQPTIDVYSKIKKQEEISIGGGYRLSLRNIRSFWIEYYQPEESILIKTYNDNGQLVEAHPHFRITGAADLTRIKAEISQIRNGEKTGNLAELEQQIKYYEGIQARMPRTADKTVPPVVTRIRIDDSEILVAPNKTYALEQDTKVLEVINAKYPIIINYICELNQVEDPSTGVVTAIRASRIWGQISGIFTNTDSIIKEGYRYDYNPGQPPYRVYSGSNIGVTKDEYGDIILDATNMHLYKILDIYKIIDQEARRQVEKMYKIQDGFYQDSEGNWISPTLKYSFSGIISLDIEAREDTVLWIGRKPDGSDAVPVRIGKTHRYKLAPMENLVRYIMLEKPSFAIINYKCLTSQMEGKFSTDYTLQSKTTTPTRAAQRILPDEGKYGLSRVTVSAIPELYQDVGGVTAEDSSVLAGKVFVDISGDTTGTMPNNGELSETIDGLSADSIVIPPGYVSGGTVKVGSGIEVTLRTI